MTKGCCTKPKCVFDSCANPAYQPQHLTVAHGNGSILRTKGLKAGQEIPVLVWVGSQYPTYGEFCPAFDLKGEPVVITSDKPCTLLIVPGHYTLDVTGIPLGDPSCCVQVCEEKLSRSELAPIAGCEFSSSAILDALTCIAELIIKDKQRPVREMTGLVETDTGLCYPVFVETVYSAKEGTETTRCVYFNPNTKEWTMANKSVPYNPSASEDICAEAQATFVVNGDDAAGTVMDKIAAVIADQAPMFEFEGKAPIAVEPGYVYDYKVQPKPCKSMDTEGNPVTMDYVTSAGVNYSPFHDDEDGGIQMDAEQIFPAGSCMIVTICARRCLSKVELAELP